MYTRLGEDWTVFWQCKPHLTDDEIQAIYDEEIDAQIDAGVADEDIVYNEYYCDGSLFLKASAVILGAFASFYV